MKNDTDNRSHTDHSLDQIAELVKRNRTLWKQLIVVESLSLALAAVLGYFLLVVLLDNLLIQVLSVLFLLVLSKSMVNLLKTDIISTQMIAQHHEMIMLYPNLKLRKNYVK